MSNSDWNKRVIARKQRPLSPSRKEPHPDAIRSRRSGAQLSAPDQQFIRLNGAFSLLVLQRIL